MQLPALLIPTTLNLAEVVADMGAGLASSSLLLLLLLSSRGVGPPY